MAIEGEAKWQSAKEELDAALAELRKELADMRSVLGGVRAQSALSSQSLAREVDPSHPANGSSEPVRMTFEEFANESGLRF